MNIAVTGGTGFLGKALCLRLAEAGHQVIALGRREDIGSDLEKNGVRFAKVKLEDRQELGRVFSEVEYVVHSGALSNAWGRYQDFYNANVQGTQNVVEACLKENIRRLIHISSPSIYFDLTSKWNIKENDPLPEKPVNAYAKTKKLAEELIDKGSSQGLSAITLRPQAIFGPGDPAIFPRLIRTNEKRGIPVFSQGKVQIDITYVDNVVDAIMLALAANEQYLGNKYNISNDEPIVLLPLLRDLFKQLGIPLKEKELPYPLALGFAYASEAFHRFFLPDREPIATPYTLGVLAKSRTLDISAAKNDLAYKPKVSVAEGLERFVKWWKLENAR